MPAGSGGGRMQSLVGSLIPGDRSEATVLAAIFLTYLSMGLYGPLLPSIQVDFGVGAGDVTLLVSSYALGRLLVDLPAGGYLTRLEPGLALALGALLVALGSALSGLAGDLQWLVTLQALRGVGMTSMIVVTLAYLGVIATPTTSARVFGRFFLAQLSALSLSPMLAGLAAAWWPWREVFLLSTIGPLIAGLGTYAVSRSPGFWISPARTTSSHAVDEAVGVRWLVGWPSYTASFLSLFAYAGAPLALFPLFGARVLAMGPDALGLALGLTAWAMVVGTYASTQLGEWIGKAQTMTLGYVALAGVVLPLLVPSTPALVAALVLVHLGIGLTASIPYALLSDRFTPAQLGTAIGIVRAAADVGWLVGPVATGLAIDRTGFAVTFWLMAGLAVAGVAVFIRESRAV